LPPLNSISRDHQHCWEPADQKESGPPQGTHGGRHRAIPNTSHTWSCTCLQYSTVVLFNRRDGYLHPFQPPGIHSSRRLKLLPTYLRYLATQDYYKRGQPVPRLGYSSQLLAISILSISFSIFSALSIAAWCPRYHSPDLPVPPQPRPLLTPLPAPASRTPIRQATSARRTDLPSEQAFLSRLCQGPSLSASMHAFHSAPESPSEKGNPSHDNKLHPSGWWRHHQQSAQTPATTTPPGDGGCFIFAPRHSQPTS